MCSLHSHTRRLENQDLCFMPLRTYLFSDIMRMNLVSGTPSYSNTLATSCEELTHWKRPWCWEGLGTGEEGDDRGSDGWMASPTRWTWVWVNSGSWWWTRRPGMLWFMGSQRVRHDWAAEMNWTELNWTPVPRATGTWFLWPEKWTPRSLLGSVRQFYVTGTTFRAEWWDKREETIMELSPIIFGTQKTLFAWSSDQRDSIFFFP